MDTARLAYLQNGQTLALAPERCIGCGICIDVCPHNVLDMQFQDPGATKTPGEGSARQVIIARREFCMECGACQKNCPAKAISVQTGVGCVAAIVNGLLRGTAPVCDCGGKDGSSCC